MASQFRKTCSNCGEGIPLSARICPQCNHVPEEFKNSLALCDCGEYNVQSFFKCWNCDREIEKTLPPASEWFCKRCGDFASQMGGTVCTNCWDYFALKRAQEKGTPTSQISLFSGQGNPSSHVRAPDCQVCAKRNEPWRSFCISCGNYLVEKQDTSGGKAQGGNGMGCLVVLAVLIFAAGAGAVFIFLNLLGI